MALIKAKIRMGLSLAAEQTLVCYPLLSRIISPEGITFAWVQDEMESIDRRALRKELEATVMSVTTFFQVANHYAIMPCAVTAGNNCGPVIVSKEPCYARHLQGRRIAHPGPLSTSYLLLRLFVNQFEEVAMSASEIIGAVAAGKVDAGVLAGREQMDYQAAGLHKVADLGEWFYETTRLPLPLYVFGIRKTLGRDVMRKVTRLLRESAVYGLEHCGEILPRMLPADAQDRCGSAEAWVRRYLDREAEELSHKVKKAIAALADIVSDNGLAAIDPRKIEYVSM